MKVGSDPPIYDSHVRLLLDTTKSAFGIDFAILSSPVVINLRLAFDYDRDVKC